MLKTKFYSKELGEIPVYGITSCLAPYVNIDDAEIVERTIDSLTRDFFPNDFSRIRTRVEGVRPDGRIYSLVDVLSWREVMKIGNRGNNSELSSGRARQI